MQNLPNLISQLRTDSLLSLLKQLGVNDIADTQVFYNENFVSFKSTTNKSAEVLAQDLQRVLPTSEQGELAIKRISLLELITEEINQATTKVKDDPAELNKEMAIVMLQMVQSRGKLNGEFDKEQRYLQIELASTAVADFLKSFNYKYLRIEGKTLKININRFLADNPKDLVLIQGEAPLLLVQSNKFEKGVYYVHKQISETEVETTPFIYVADKTPRYTLIADTSGSMKLDIDGREITESSQQGQSRLAIMKENMKNMADAIWKAHPAAKIGVKSFSESTSEIEIFDKDHQYTFKKCIDDFSAAGDTRLYHTMEEQINEFRQSEQFSNAILVTDGENTVGDKEQLEQQMAEWLQKLEKTENVEVFRERHRFFVVSCNTKQADIVHKITQFFGSQIINSQDPSFKELNDEQRLAYYAAHDLFSISLSIQDSTSQYTMKIPLCGQFVSLKPIISAPGDTLRISVVDGDKHTVVKNTTIVKSTAMLAKTTSTESMSSSSQQSSSHSSSFSSYSFGELSVSLGFTSEFEKKRKVEYQKNTPKQGQTEDELEQSLPLTSTLLG